MNYKISLLFILLLVIIGGILISRTANKKIDNVSPKVTQQPVNQTQTDEKGAVTVKATPKILAKGRESQFDIVFDTHSVELDYDIGNNTQLTDDGGNTYKPLSWTGGKGGHHLEGVLTFPVLSESKIVTLTIPAIDNSDRVFTWKLNM